MKPGLYWAWHKELDKWVIIRDRGTAVPKITEFELQRALCLWLDNGALMPNVLYWHTPNGGSRNAFEGKRFKDIGVKPGIFDLTFLYHGCLFVLELKDADGKLSDAQRVMWDRYKAAGAAGIAVVNNLESARMQLFHWGLTVNKT